MMVPLRGLLMSCGDQKVAQAGELICFLGIVVHCAKPGLPPQQEKKGCLSWLGELWGSVPWL